MRALAFASLLALAGCRSSAPHTLGAAAINTGVAATVAGAQRASGGCYATCAHGTVCNPKTGLCESRDVSQTYCEEAPGGGVRCIPLQIGKEEQPRPDANLPVGVSPATGTVQPPPAEASPRGP